MGAWPCGTIVLLNELFGTESKSQVYGSIHTLLAENEKNTGGIGKSINKGTCLTEVFNKKCRKSTEDNYIRENSRPRNNY